MPKAAAGAMPPPKTAASKPAPLPKAAPPAKPAPPPKAPPPAQPAPPPKASPWARVFGPAPGRATDELAEAAGQTDAEATKRAPEEAAPIVHRAPAEPEAASPRAAAPAERQAVEPAPAPAAQPEAVDSEAVEAQVVPEPPEVVPGPRDELAGDAARPVRALRMREAAPPPAPLEWTRPAPLEPADQRGHALLYGLIGVLALGVVAGVYLVGRGPGAPSLLARIAALGGRKPASDPVAFVEPTAGPTGALTMTEAPPATPTPSPTATPPPTSTPAPTAAPVVHVVQRGENLVLIAQQYGVTVAELMAANGIQDGAVIKVGQQLTIPSKATPPPTPAATEPPTATPTPTLEATSPALGAVAITPTAEVSATAAYEFTAPVLLNPADGAVVQGAEDVLLNWTSVGLLGDNTWYVVKIWRDDPTAPTPATGWTRTTAWRIPASFEPPAGAASRRFFWTVTVMRSVEGSAPEAVSPVSQERWFDWQ